MKTLIFAGIWLWSCGSSGAATETGHVVQEHRAVFQLTGNEACDFPEDGLAIASGHAEGAISGQDAKLEAEQIVFDKYTQTVEAIGNVHIWRHQVLTTGSKFVFRIESDEYLVTQPATKVAANDVISRKMLGTGDKERLEYGALKLSRQLYKYRLTNVESFFSGEHHIMYLDGNVQQAIPKSNQELHRPDNALDEFLHGNRQSYFGYDAF